MYFNGAQKWCKKCGKEITNELREVRIYMERFKIHDYMCVYCINKEARDKR